MKQIKSLISLKGKVALVTGATGKLGVSIVKGLSDLGADIILTDRHEKKLENLSKKISKIYNNKCFYFKCDLSNNDDLVELISWIDKKFKKINILINNAALVGDNDLEGWAVPFKNQSLKAWNSAIEINLTANFSLIQGIHKKLDIGKGGTIINIGSIYGSKAPRWSLYKDLDMQNPAAYGVSKAGLIQFTKWLSSSLAPKVRVNSISPGGIFRKQNKKFIKRYSNMTPLQRMATEEDLIGAVVYLSTDLSEYVTGQDLIVDGGWST